MNKKQLISSFEEKFGTPEIIIRVPGRANIIGEHTDYNQGLVLPFAINKHLYFAAKKNNSSKFNIHAENVKESVMMSKSDGLTEGWQRFFSSILDSLEEDVSGMDISFGGDLPIGAGLSSSSAIVCGFLFLIKELNGINWNPDELTAIAFTIEAGSGVEGGMMDQTTILQAKKDHAIFLDCATRNIEYLPISFEDHKWYLMDTGVSHNLVDSKYNERRRECANILKTLHTVGALYESLRDLDKEDLPDLRHILTKPQFNRASYVINENDRVSKSLYAIKKKDLDLLGQMLYDSHKGLRYHFEVSCPELDFLVDQSKEVNQILGSRMMGGGFGGCTLNLVEGNLSDDIQTKLSNAYKTEFDKDLNIFEVTPVDGIQVVK